jgi:hypothetical protein
MSWFVCPLLWGETTLRAFSLSAPWQIYEILCLLLGVQECRFITPSQGGGLMVLSMEGWDTHLSFRFPDNITTSKSLSYRICLKWLLSKYLSECKILTKTFQF